MAHPWLILSKMVARSWLTKWRSLSAPPEATFGSTHLEKPLEASLDYIDSCYRDYLTYGPLSPADLSGIDVLEGGPGDNFGIGLRFLAAGARRYVGADPFRSVLDPAQQKRIYAGLRTRLVPAEQKRFDECVELTPDLRFHDERLQAIYGPGIGDFKKAFPPESFDLVISRAVLEQVHDIEGAFRSMDRVLKPGGLLLHKIDLSDYGIFSRKGHHPLTLLTFPDWAYGCLASNTGNLNRYVLDDYRRLMQRMGYKARLYVTGTIQPGYPQRDLAPYVEKLRKGVDYGTMEEGLVDAIKPRLVARYRAMPPEDLIAAGVFLSARKGNG